MDKITLCFMSGAGIFFFIFGVSEVCAETLILKSGKKVSGEIIEKTEEAVTLDVDGEEKTFLSAEIEKISEAEVISGPYTQEIRSVIKNFFEHRFDEDKSKAEESVSDSGKSAMKNGEWGAPMRQGVRLVSLQEFKVVGLDFEGENIAKATVAFLQTLSNDGKLEKKPVEFLVVLNKESGAWKITALSRFKPKKFKNWSSDR